ncbi:MAG: lytic transglycosylase domain-containing protein [Acidobacteria bacterium]|nr:lytic transglycosylase domain-containing protein [Acidobacteriota bacterium]
MIKILAVLGVIIALTLPCNGEIYTYRDRNGHLVLTDAPQGSHRVRKKHHSNQGKKAAKSNRNHHGPLVSKDHEINRLVEKYAVLYDLDERLLHAVIRTESDYDRNAVSQKGAMGLMQLMPETGKQYGVENFFNPEENIRAGAKHLKSLLDRYFGDTKMALAAYNAGITAVDRYNGIPPFQETENYVSKILSMVNGEDSSESGNTSRPQRTTIYRYTDAKGRICLTNIYPGNVSGVVVVHQ